MSRPPVPAVILMALLACAVTGGDSRAGAQEPQAQSWPEVKCARYKKAWGDLLAHRGTRGLGQEFLDRHEAFLASGCSIRGDVCPRSAEELEAANMMVVAAMNAGTASTFPPFSCRK